METPLHYHHRDFRMDCARCRLEAAAPAMLTNLRMVLARLDLEAKDKGEGAEFICAGMRKTIRDNIAKATTQREGVAS